MKRILDTFSKTAIANILAVLIVIGCFGMQYLMMVLEVPERNVQLVSQASSFVFAMLSFIMGYFYGSSKPQDKI